MRKTHHRLLAVFFLAVLALSGCGGGGGGGAIAPAPPDSPSQSAAKGTITGYVYTPIGAARTSGRVAEPLRILASAPAGYEPVVGATVTCTGTTESAVTDSNGMYTLTSVEPGAQKITVTAAGKKIMEQDVTVNPGTSSVADAVYVTPETSNNGAISVTSAPSGARVYLDNTDTSYETPHVFENVITGSHIVYVTKDGYIVPTPLVFTVTAGTTATADFTLVTDNSSQGTGLLLMSSEEYESIPVASPPPTGSGALPSRIDLSDKIPPVKSQGNQGSCTAWATAYYLKGYQEKVERGWDTNSSSHQFSPAYVYNQAKEPGSCSVGTYIIKALDLIQSQGVSTWDAFPYDSQSTTSCTQQPGASVKQAATDFKIGSWKRVRIDTDEIKGFLNAGQPVVIGIRVYQNLSSLQRGQIHKSNDGTPFTGKYHAILVVGYDDAKNAFKIVNSWGTWWGDDGYGWIDYSWFGQIVVEAYIAEDVTASVCGNGKVESGEQCDDGNTSTETCSYGQSSCTVCNASCQSVQGATSYCGDGRVNGSEQCDDGNSNNTDSCSNTCRTNAPTPVCGNGTVEQGEQCDDGNTVTETCIYGQTSCTVCGATCNTVSGATAYCGDGRINGTEQCDDGNTNNNDSCTNTCRNNNPGPVCGNGIVETGEICDDGNTAPVGAADSCGTNCRYIQWNSSPYVNQYSCSQDFGTWNPGYNGYSIANAACAESAVTMLTSLYPTGLDRYDCSTVNALIQGYLGYTGKSMNTFINDGTVGRSLCEWVNGSSLNVSCQYYEYSGTAAVSQMKQFLKTGPVVLGLNPFKNSSGQVKSNYGHYILVRGYNEDDGLFVVNDSAGNADQNWGGEYNGELMGYNLNVMLNGVTGKFLVIRQK